MSSLSGNIEKQANIHVLETMATLAGLGAWEFRALRLELSFVQVRFRFRLESMKSLSLGIPEEHPAGIELELSISCWSNPRPQ